MAMSARAVRCCAALLSRRRAAAAAWTTTGIPRGPWSSSSSRRGQGGDAKTSDSQSEVLVKAALSAVGVATACVATTTACAEESSTQEETKWTPPPFAGVSGKKVFQLPSYEDDVCVVTGGSTGIGRATCEALARAGGTVYSLDVRPPPTPFAEKRVAHVTVDVSDVEGLRKAIDAIAEKHDGRVDLLVSNAGVWTGGEMAGVTEAQYERVMAINVKGCFFSIQSVLPYMRKRKTGSIVVVGSDQSLIGKPQQNLYGMTKGAIAQLAKSCAAEYAPEGIRVNVVCPGTIDTPLMHGAVREFAAKNKTPPADLYKWLETAQPYPRLGEPAEVAALIACLAKIPFVVGSVVSVDGGYTCQ